MPVLRAEEFPARALADAPADDAAAADERVTGEEARSRRTRNLRSSVSRGLSSLLSRRKSRTGSDTAPNDEEDNEFGEEDGGEASSDLLVNDVEDEDADASCIVCMDAPRDSTVLPCRHMCATPGQTPTDAAERARPAVVTSCRGRGWRGRARITWCCT
jgi:hypothetical protein